jgi:hypothetical protein
MDRAKFIGASMRLHRYTANEQWKAAYQAAVDLDSLLGIPNPPATVTNIRTVAQSRGNENESR